MSGGKGDAGTGGSIDALLKKLREALTCHPRVGWAPHYCPNCDNSFGPELVDELAALLTRRDQPDEYPVGSEWWIEDPREVTRTVRVVGKQRGKIAVRNVNSGRLSYVHPKRLKPPAATRRDAPQEPPTYSREEFERDRFGETGETLAAQHRAGRDADPAKEPGWQPIEHGKTCRKEKHLGDGYLHGEYDDRPYDVDGVLYCGRCHSALAVAAKEPEPQ